MKRIIPAYCQKHQKQTSLLLEFLAVPHPALFTFIHVFMVFLAVPHPALLEIQGGSYGLA